MTTLRRSLRVVFNPFLLTLGLMTLIFAPILLLTKAIRYARKNLKREFDSHRWNCPVWNMPQNTAEKPAVRVVLLGTGLGEMRIVEQLCEALKQTHPDADFIWATRDLEAAQAARASHPQQAISFLPFDAMGPTLNFLRHNRPDVVVFVEKFWFPNLACGCAAWGARCVVVNARTRSHEGLRYRLMRPYHRWILRSFARMSFQSEEDLRRVEKTLPNFVRTQVAGNLKFEVDPRARVVADDLRHWLEARNELPLLAAGSTHDAQEDALVFDAFEIVRRSVPCVLLIAPRRIHRAAEIVEMARARGWTVSRRIEYSMCKDPMSKNLVSEKSASEKIDVFCLDTVGELAVAYRYAQAAYVGGTLNSAGHNMAEPLYWGIPVSYGASRGFFETVKKACETAGVGYCVRTPEQLAAHWLEALNDDAKREQWRAQTQILLEQQSGALERNVQQARAEIDFVASQKGFANRARQ